MGSTGSVAILFYCICIVASSSMVVVESAVPEQTPKFAVPEYAVSKDTQKPVVPEETSKSAVPVNTPKYAVQEATPKSAVPDKSTKSATPVDTPKYAFPKDTPKSAVPEKTPKSAAPKDTPNYAVPEDTPKLKSAVPKGALKPAAPKKPPKFAAPKETPKSGTLEKLPKSATPQQTPKFISMGALDCSNNVTRTKSARKLVAVQGTGVCPVRFDHTRGISAVTGSCKDRPVPSAERCCGALKTYACPYSDLINDNANNGCASEMFYVIMVRGRLRPGLFSSLCVEGPLGLQC